MTQSLLPYQDGKTWRDKKFQADLYCQAKKNVKPYKQKIEFIKKHHNKQ